jgi:hypothetical protein
MCSYHPNQPSGVSTGFCDPFETRPFGIDIDNHVFLRLPYLLLESSTHRVSRPLVDLVRRFVGLWSNPPHEIIEPIQLGPEMCLARTQ